MSFSNPHNVHYFSLEIVFVFMYSILPYFDEVRPNRTLESLKYFSYYHFIVDICKIIQKSFHTTSCVTQSIESEASP